MGNLPDAVVAAIELLLREVDGSDLVLATDYPPEVLEACRVVAAYEAMIGADATHTGVDPDGDGEGFDVYPHLLRTALKRGYGDRHD